MRIGLVLPLLPLLLAGCMFGGDDSYRPAVPPPQPRASGPVTIPDPEPRETRQCYADLTREGVRFDTVLDRDYGGGCVVTGAIQLLDIGVPVTNLKAIRCPMARTFTAWVRFAVAPAARQILGSDLVRIETFGSYACRGIVGAGEAASRRVSEHGRANAIDVSGFVLRDGRRITIEAGWHSDDPAIRRFLETIHSSACRRFGTVLSPDYNAAHYNHLHLDMGRGPFCR